MDGSRVASSGAHTGTHTGNLGHKIQRLRRVFAQGPLLLSLSFLSDGWEGERVLHYVHLPLLPPNCEGKHQPSTSSLSRCSGNTEEFVFYVPRRSAYQPPLWNQVCGSLKTKGPSKEEIQTANKRVQRYATSLIIREIQIKPTIVVLTHNH